MNVGDEVGIGVTGFIVGSGAGAVVGFMVRLLSLRSSKQQTSHGDDWKTEKDEILCHDGQIGVDL